MILIETFIIAMNYYINKLPIYSYNGKIINPSLLNKNNNNKYTIDIDKKIIELLGIKYRNPFPDKRKKKKIEENILKETINNFTEIGKILLMKHLINYEKYREFLKKKIEKEINISDTSLNIILEKKSYNVSELFIKEINNLSEHIELEEINFNKNPDHIKENDKSLNALFYKIDFPISIPYKDYNLHLNKDGYQQDKMDNIILLDQYKINRPISKLPFFKN